MAANPTILHLNRRQLLHALAVALSITVLTAVRARAEVVTLTETGSTLLYPLFTTWVTNYTQTHPGVSITTDPTGSEAGVKKVISGEAQIGASDAFMSDADVKRNPQIVNIALCISAQMLNYNLPGLNGKVLKLDGPVLAGIYSGKIRDWDAGPIVALNPGLRLPHHPIIPVRRAEGSGDTFMFTQFLTFSEPGWGDNIGYGTTINWPLVPDEPKDTVLGSLYWCQLRC